MLNFKFIPDFLWDYGNIVMLVLFSIQFVLTILSWQYLMFSAQNLHICAATFLSWNRCDIYWAEERKVTQYPKNFHPSGIWRYLCRVCQVRSSDPPQGQVKQIFPGPTPKGLSLYARFDKDSKIPWIDICLNLDGDTFPKLKMHWTQPLVASATFFLVRFLQNRSGFKWFVDHKLGRLKTSPWHQTKIEIWWWAHTHTFPSWEYQMVRYLKTGAKKHWKLWVQMKWYKLWKWGFG